jgi:anhydro-N-acetylmuramic acid kinase
VQRTPELFIGLMSGTSLDGIDAVLVDLSCPGPCQLGSHYIPFSGDLKLRLLALHQPTHNELHLSQLVSNELAHAYAAAVTSLLTKTDVANNSVIAIGCHGQTIRHCPEHGYTVQIGNATLLAELTGITVISDFRSRDIAAGGQGAPLVPAFHAQVFRSPDVHRVIVNIGGISNLTNLPPHATTSGFDCGPGNLLMDAWCMIHQSTPYDDNGAWAASGLAIPTLLSKLLSEPFFSRPPPKSSGRDLLNMAWLKDKLHGDERPEDVQATLLELTCLTIAQAIQRYCTGAKEVYLCGGGAHNLALHNRLTTLLKDSRVLSTSALGVDSDFLEAIAFAWLAQQTLQSKPANLPEVTGARHPCILGAIHRA